MQQAAGGVEEDLPVVGQYRAPFVELHVEAYPAVGVADDAVGLRVELVDSAVAGYPDVALPVLYGAQHEVRQDSFAGGVEFGPAVASGAVEADEAVAGGGRPQHSVGSEEYVLYVDVGGAREVLELHLLGLVRRVAAYEEAERAAGVEFPVGTEAGVPHPVELLGGEGDAVLAADELAVVVAEVDVGQAAVERGYPEPVGVGGVEVVDLVAVGGVVCVVVPAVVAWNVGGGAGARRVLRDAHAFGARPYLSVGGFGQGVYGAGNGPCGDFIESLVEQVHLPVAGGGIDESGAALQHGSHVVGPWGGVGAAVEDLELEFAGVVSCVLQTSPGAGEPEVVLGVDVDCVDVVVAVPAVLEFAVVELHEPHVFGVVPVQGASFGIQPDVAAAVGELSDGPARGGEPLDSRAPLSLGIPAEESFFGGAAQEFRTSRNPHEDLHGCFCFGLENRDVVSADLEQLSRSAADILYAAVVEHAEPGEFSQEFRIAVDGPAGKGPDVAGGVPAYEIDGLVPWDGEISAQGEVVAVAGELAFEYGAACGGEAEVGVAQFEYVGDLQGSCPLRIAAAGVQAVEGPAGAEHPQAPEAVVFYVRQPVVVRDTGDFGGIDAETDEVGAVEAVQPGPRRQPEVTVRVLDYLRYGGGGDSVALLIPREGVRRLGRAVQREQEHQTGQDLQFSHSCHTF